MKKEDINVCTRFAEERKRLTLSQNKVASACAVASKTVGRWERNTPIPSDKLALLQPLGFDVLYVVTGTPKSDARYYANPQDYRHTGQHGISEEPVPAYVDASKAQPLGIGPGEQQWLDWYRQIDPEDRAFIEPVVKGLAERSQARKNRF